MSEKVIDFCEPWHVWLYDSHGSTFCIFSMPLWPGMLRAGKQFPSKAAISVEVAATFHLAEMLLLFPVALLFPFIRKKSHSESA